MSSNQKEECCPRFDAKQWDDKLIEWDNKRFIRKSVKTFFYMPLNFGSVMKKLDKELQNAGTPLTDNICLSDHTSKWNMDIYVNVDSDIKGLDNRVLTGKFFSKVYEGPYKDTEKWSKDFEEISKSKGLNIKKSYMWYTTCPKCAKKYGKNYVTLIAQVD